MTPFLAGVRVQERRLERLVITTAIEHVVKRYFVKDNGI